MAAGEWFAQLHPIGGGKAEEPIYFPDFAATLAFVKTPKGQSSGNILRVHVPVRATYQERQQLITNGATPVWLSEKL
jgi:hypothetical protein